MISSKIHSLALDFKDVLIRPRPTSVYSRKEVSLARSFSFKNSNALWSGVPIIAANMDTTGTFEVHNVLSSHNCLTALHKFYNVEDFQRQMERYPTNYLFWENMIISTGISQADRKHLDDVLSQFPIRWICIDVANGYMHKFVDFCASVRAAYPDKIIIAGNVATPEMVKTLLNNGGVDIVKIGIGPGSVCLTRAKAGVGVPQLTAVMECANTAHSEGGHVICDGGITCPGDMSKAFVGGADFVMCGGAFSGHDENPGELFEENGKKFKLFYGMSSEHAMKTHYGKMAKYRSSEGRVIRVKYRGPLEDTLLDYMGGVRSACAYTDCHNIEEMETKGEFVRVTQQLNTSLVS